MNALITKNGVETRFSSIGLLVTDFRDSSPPVTMNKREVTNRSGYIFSEVVYKEKRIVVSGTFAVPNAYVSEEKKDEIDGLISSDEPFYITRLLSTASLYDFELLDRKTSDLDLFTIPRHAYEYYYRIIAENELSYTLVRFSVVGIRMKFPLGGRIAELPFGETVPETVLVSTSIDYTGIARCSQPEWPWIVKLTASQSQDGNFFLKIGDGTFTYQTQAALENGDILLLKGVEVILNDLNVNDKVNYEHFILAPVNANRIGIQTNFKGTIQLLNFVELYK